MAKAIIIGAGTIGAELANQLRNAGHTVVANVSRRLIGKPDGTTGDVIKAFHMPNKYADVAFIAIPTGDRGQAECEYIEYFLGRGIPVVTSAKGAFAYHYPKLLPHLKQIGFAATCGGGTDMLHMLTRRELHDKDVTVYVVLNGTLNYVWSSIQAGRSFAAAISEARRLGYAEPNGDNAIAVVNGELKDACMKSTILHNVALVRGGAYLTPEMFDTVDVTSKDIGLLTSRNARYRFIVTFTTVDDPDAIPPGAAGSMRAKVGRWTIRGGFHNVGAETPFFDWLRQVDGVNNGFTVHRALGEDTGHSMTGPGAGPETTAAAMVRDMHRLLAA